MLLFKYLLIECYIFDYRLVVFIWFFFSFFFYFDFVSVDFILGYVFEGIGLVLRFVYLYVVLLVALYDVFGGCINYDYIVVGYV